MTSSQEQGIRHKRADGERKESNASDLEPSENQAVCLCIFFFVLSTRAIKYCENLTSET